MCGRVQSCMVRHATRRLLQLPAAAAAAQPQRHLEWPAAATAATLELLLLAGLHRQRLALVAHAGGRTLLLAAGGAARVTAC